MKNLTMFHGSVVTKPEAFVYDIYGVYILFIGLFGCIENGCVILVFIRSKLLWTPSNIFVFDLVCSDFLICTIGFPFLMLSSFYQSWIFDISGCYVYAFSMSITGMHSIFILFVIAVERFNAVFYPLQTVKTVTVKRSIYFVICCWTLGVIISIPPLVGWNRYVLEGLQISCSFDMFDTSWQSKSYTMLLIGTFLLILTAIIICYVKIFFKVRDQIKEMRIVYTKSFNNLQRIKESKVERKLIYMGFNVTLFFVLSWGPYAMVTILALCNVLTEKGSVLIVAIPAYFAKSFTICNPVIYILNYPQFKRELYKLLCVLKQIPCQKKQSQTTQNLSTITRHVPSAVQTPPNQVTA